MASPARSRAQAALLAELQRRGPASAPELCERLGLSQPVFSRLVKGLGESLLRVGRARATRYSARRTLQGVGDRCPVYEVAENGTTRRAAILRAAGDLPERPFEPPLPTADVAPCFGAVAKSPAAHRRQAMRPGRGSRGHRVRPRPMRGRRF